jgi:serine/threonine protein kinase
VTVAAKLSHPNIVTAYDADQVGGNHLLVMEYVDGSDLWATVKKDGPLPIEKAVDCVLQAARGLEAAHAAGIFHRDIKPSNLILDKSGKVKVVDLGLASLTMDDPDQAPLTEDGTVLGTADFISPEQAVETRSADARSDVYSLGCTLFFLLTGRVMYPAETLMQKMLAHREQPVPSLRDLRPEVSEQLAAVYGKMVAKRADERQQSMTEVIGDLESLQRDGALAVEGQRTSPLSMLEGVTSVVKPSSSTSKTVVSSRSATFRIQHDAKRRWVKRSLIGGSVALAGIVLVLLTRNGGQDVDPARTPGKKEARDAQPSLHSKPARDTRPPPENAGGDGAPVVANPAAVARSPDPEFGKWLARTADLPAEEQVAAVAAKLQELNPGSSPRSTSGRSRSWNSRRTTCMTSRRCRCFAA